MADLTPVSNDMAAITTPAPVSGGEKPAEPVKDLNKKIADALKTRTDNSETYRRTFMNDWKRNVDIILGQPIPLYTEGLDIDADLQSSVNPDWSLTKTKTANLFSTVPTIRGTHVSESFLPAIAPFLKQLNYEISPKRANAAVMMRECLSDVVNASGIAACITTYNARFDSVQLPTQDPMLPAPPSPPVPPAAAPPIEGQPAGSVAGAAPPAAPAPVSAPTAAVARPVSYMFRMDRISPRDLLWPSEFVGSDFNDADFMGHTGRCSKAVGKVDFKLTDDELQKALATALEDSSKELRSHQENKIPKTDLEEIVYKEVFYWRYRQDPLEKNFKSIWRIVYVNGLDEPKIHEPYKGQRYNPRTKQYIGVQRLPIQAVTLAYITDNPVPPSDTQAGRPQVNDMRRSRSQMFQNRQRSIPIRWFDVNRIDQDLQANLMRGIVQGMLPTNGPGDKAIGEIARASYPSENLAFDQAAQSDLEKSWQLGPNQTGTTQPGRHTADEANIVQQNFNTRIGQERAFIAQFLLNNCEVLAGLMVLFSDFSILSPQEKQVMMASWDSKSILADLALNIVPDSTVLIDADSRVKMLMQTLNMLVQSGFVNPKPIITEILELRGLDPAKIMVDPKPKSDDPNISYRFTGKDDMMNPMVVAMLIKAGQAPSQDEVDQAKALLDSMVAPTPPPQGPGGPGGPTGAPAGPAGPEPPNGQQPPAHPQWEQAPKIATRSREVSGGA